ncbi:MAG: 3-isopropylmalate dehydratase small subunit [Pseudomonadales bacterium]
MKSVSVVSGTVAPLDRANIDTDQIIPKQFLKSIRRTGFGDYLFDAWRFLDEGDLGMTPNERRINHAFVLNDRRYQGASVLLARSNFGCGSSREHAVWSLLEYGIECVIAPSFADIFYSNCFKNGLLPVTLAEAEIDALFALASGSEPLVLRVDLPAQTVVAEDGRTWRFEMDADRKRTLQEGLDEIEVTLVHRSDIEVFEAGYQVRRPWLQRARR